MVVPLRFTRGEAQVFPPSRRPIRGALYSYTIKTKVNAEKSGRHGTDLRAPVNNSL